MLERVKMLSKIKNWFSKGDEDLAMCLPKDENVSFALKIKDVVIGWLHCENGTWEFYYDEEFKNRHSNDYRLITGFPKLQETYKNETLWPFFRTRIPGLRQPAIREIIEEEKIDKNNEAELLKRFGQFSITNPYELKAG